MTPLSQATMRGTEPDISGLTTAGATCAGDAADVAAPAGLPTHGASTGQTAGERRLNRYCLSRVCAGRRGPPSFQRGTHDERGSMSVGSKADYPVAIIGAGPNGLATAAYLRAAGVQPLVFGETMKFWRENMPTGMLLRSGLRDSSIAHPGRKHSLEWWAAEHGRELQVPIPRQDFLDYADWYQRELVPGVDHAEVREVSRNGSGFTLRLD